MPKGLSKSFGVDIVCSYDLTGLALQPSVSKQENHAIRGLKAEEEELEISDISAEHGTDSRQRRNGRQSTAVEIN